MDGDVVKRVELHRSDGAQEGRVRVFSMSEDFHDGVLVLIFLRLPLYYYFLFNPHPTVYFY